MRTLYNQAGDPQGGGGGSGAPDPGAGNPPSDQPWHSLVLQGEGEQAKLNDPAQWLDKAPAPLAKFIKDQMTAARAKTDGMVRIPGEQATPEEWAAFHKAIGVPEKPEDYGLQPPAKLPEGVQHDAAMEAAFLSKAKELGLNKKQVEALRDWQVEAVGQSVMQAKQTMAQQIEAEKKELQARFGDKLDSTIAEGKSLLNAKGVPEGIKKYINEGGLDPQSGNFGGADFVEFAAWVSRATGEDRGAGGVRGGNNGNSVEHWQSVMKDKSHPDYIALARKDPDAVARYNAAYAAAAGSGLRTFSKKRIATHG